MSGTPMRVSTTVLEAFRLFMEGDWMTEESLIATIEGRVERSAEMNIGQAYHECLEKPHRCRDLFGGYSSQGIRFDAPAIDEMLALLDPRGIFETKLTTEIDGCVIVAKVDYLLGACVSEFKTTFDGFDAEKYMASYQWRLYSLIFDPMMITYRVAQLGETDDGVFLLRSLDSMNVFPYSTLKGDCRSLIREFVQYVKMRGLDGVLREKQQQAMEREAVAR